ncbi:MAG TPA: PAS domain S-box protein [Chitinophaga sp.]|uniref:PAS domain S-box protein n=1 Tax=Chitinophaga sp. TaxID=1869181 RepID=UPI002C7D3FD0|nr:PAS domain S-box protein [Chitinophaga sp.]HVI43725.1 PAS domain S-box protein [Chitinophaga sp.]
MSLIDVIVSDRFDFLAGGGETADLIRRYPWENTPVGPISAWPASLKMSLGIILTSRHPMCIWWGEDLINFYNDAFRQLIPGKHPGSIGQQANAVWKEAWPQIGQRVRQVLRNGVGTVEKAAFLIMKRPDCLEEVYYTFSFSPVAGSEGQVAGMIGTVSDDTDHVFTERQCQTLKEISLFNRTCRKPSAIYMQTLRALQQRNQYDIPFAFFYEKDKALHLNAYTYIPVSASTLPAVMERESAGQLWPVMEAITTGQPVIVPQLSEKFGMLPAGAWSRQPDNAIVIPVCHRASGEVYGALIIGLNPYRPLDEKYQSFLQQVTDNMAADIAAVSRDYSCLREDAQQHLLRLAAIVQHSDDAIVSKTSEGIITSWNPAAEKLFGYSAAEITGQPITRIIPPELLDEEVIIMEQLKQGNNVDHFETKRMTKDGRLLDVSLTISPLRDAAGNFIGASKIARDITEQKRLFSSLRESEARYMQIAMDMDAMIARRTRELTEANLSLERTNKELEQFAFVTSHDLQEPLRKIHTFGGLLHNAELNNMSGASRIYLQKMMTSAQRMSQLIHDLLNFSRLTCTDDIFVMTDLNDVMKHVLSDFELTISQKKAKIEIGPLPVLHAVPLQMNQLLFNLLGNALKFTADNRQPRISVTSRLLSNEDCSNYPELDPAKRYYEIIVKDNGIGFSQMYEAKIFQIFQRLNSRSAYEGTGIGLALCNKIALNHRGCIHATGSPERGAAFHVMLHADLPE